MIDKLLNNEDGSLKFDSDEQNIYPLICMASVEPVKIKKSFTFGSQHSFEKLNSFQPLFSINFSAFKRENDDLSHLTFVIAAISSLKLPPQIISTATSNDEESKDFLLTGLSRFASFKKAIIAFEKRAYSLKEFEDTVMDWQKSLEKIINE